MLWYCDSYLYNWCVWLFYRWRQDIRYQIIWRNYIYFFFLRLKSFWALCDWTGACRQQNVSRSFSLRVLIAWFHTKASIGVMFLNQFRCKENNLFFVYVFYLIFRIPCKTSCPAFTPFLPHFLRFWIRGVSLSHQEVWR